ncbi:MAG: porin family protein [Bacteroides sp.]|nr:porin family protein [Bacteroides sp.]
MKSTCIHLISVFCISLFTMNSKAQEEKPIRYLLEIGGGTNLLLSHTSSMNPTSLLSYRQRALPVFNIQYTYFLGSHWGIYANLQAMLPGRKNRMLCEALASPYENDYYISGYREDQDANTLAYGIVGIAYRMRWNKWSVSPRLGLGFAETRITSLDFTLKGKENNEIYQISYNTKKNTDHTTGILSAGTSIHYHISRRVSFYTDITYMQSHQRPTYRFRQTDLYEGEIITEKKYNSPHQSHLNLSVGIGIHL